MSHEGKMRRGKLLLDHTNPDRIYFLENSQPNPDVDAIAKPVEKPVKEKKEKKDDSN